VIKIPSNETGSASDASGIADRSGCKLRSWSLTNREKDVLQLVAQGMSNRVVGETLRISARTVEAHRTRIMLKLKLGSLAELVRYAMRNHLVEP
jgi:DNA-binding NarL/FixJ family response regulator